MPKKLNEKINHIKPLNEKIILMKNTGTLLKNKQTNREVSRMRDAVLQKYMAEHTLQKNLKTDKGKVTTEQNKNTTQN